MAQDLCVKMDEGYLNIRVGAIIRRGGKLLMVANDELNYCYTVGGRIQFGESAEEALRRELREETGYELEIGGLGFVHEDFFRGDLGIIKDKLVYEIGFHYFVKTPEDFAPRCDRSVEEGSGEHLEWIDLNTERTIYPTFFRTELDKPRTGVRHFVTDER